MKQNQITYSRTYTSADGFEPYRYKKHWVFERTITLYADYCSGGRSRAFVQIDVTDTCLSQFDNFHFNINQQIPIKNFSFYSADHSEQALNMEMLASNELRGKTAETVAHALFWDLIVKNEEISKNILPIKVYEHFQKFIKDAEENS